MTGSQAFLAKSWAVYISLQLKPKNKEMYAKRHFPGVSFFKAEVIALVFDWPEMISGTSRGKCCNCIPEHSVRIPGISCH